MRIQTKTGILFTVITATLLLIISTTSYFITSKFVSRDFHKRLELRVIVATKVLFDKEHTSAIAYEDLRKRYLESLPQEREYVFPADTLETLRLSKVKSEIPFSFLKSIQEKNGETVYYFNGNTDYAGILHKGNTGEFLVIKSAVNEYGINTLLNLRNIKIATFILGVIIVYTTGIFFARKTFQPVREIINKSKNISAYNLGLRLEETQGGDEIGELAKTFNTMLDRLQTAFETQNNFISNASHELRTPLTNIIGEADWALSKNRTDSEYKQSILVIQQHADKLNKITSDLLTLAQSSFNGKQQDHEEMGVLELIEESAFSVRNLIKGTAISINISHQQLENSDLTLTGNKTLLKLALGNIIANGAKYSNQKNVAIGVEVLNDMVRILITDQGIGIPEREISKIFEPFFRASNTGAYEGYGVGLPLAMNIIRIHHGNIDVSSTEGMGTTVAVSLPISPIG